MKEIKERHAMWFYPSTVGLMNNLISVTNSKSPSDFTESALLFYCGYISSLEKNQFLPEILCSSLDGMINSSEGRISKLLFKMVVEQNMMMRVISSQYEIDEDYLQKLRGLAIDDVKLSNGHISLRDINKGFDR